MVQGPGWEYLVGAGSGLAGRVGLGGMSGQVDETRGVWQYLVLGEKTSSNMGGEFHFKHVLLTRIKRRGYEQRNVPNLVSIRNDRTTRWLTAASISPLRVREALCTL